MMNEGIDIALLEQYRDSKISSKEVLNYDGTPVSAEELRSALEDFENLTIHLKAIDLEKSLKVIHKDVLKREERISSIRRWSVAAAILMLATFSFLLLKPSEPNFSDYFSHFDQLVTTRDSDSTNYSIGLQAYTLKDYNKAYTSLEEIDNLNDELKFYKGVSALGSLRSSEAIEIFEQLGMDSSNKYYQQVRWYLGLALWQSDDSKSAINVLRQISAGEYNYQESQKLMEQLKD